MSLTGTKLRVHCLNIAVGKVKSMQNEAGYGGNDWGAAHVLFST